MSKFLKFIVALILIVFIGAGAALIVPPFFGVDAVVVSEETASYLPVGTAIYTRTMDLSNLKAGAKVLTQESNSAYIHTIREYNAEEKMAETEDGQILSFSSAYREVYFTVPLIGYLSIATQSQFGLIILLLLLALVVILFIISEVLRSAKRRSEEAEEEEDDDDEFYSSLVEKRRRREEKGETGLYTFDKDKKPKPSLPEQPAAVAEEAGKTVAIKPEEKAQFRDIFAEKTVVSLTEPAKESAPAVSAESSKTGGEESLPDVQAALEAALEKQQLGRTETIQLPPEAEQAAEFEQLPLEEVELAIPSYTADELIQKAYAEGHDPTVIRDETTGITLVDFSECL